MHMVDHGGYYMGGVHGFWWALWLVLIGFLVFHLLTRLSSRRQNAHRKPLDVLQQRLAAGELSTEAYEKRKSLLDRDDAVP